GVESAAALARVGPKAWARHRPGDRRRWVCDFGCPPDARHSFSRASAQIHRACGGSVRRGPRTTFHPFVGPLNLMNTRHSIRHLLSVAMSALVLSSTASCKPADAAATDPKG